MVPTPGRKIQKVLPCMPQQQPPTGHGTKPKVAAEPPKVTYCCPLHDKSRKQTRKYSQLHNQLFTLLPPQQPTKQHLPGNRSQQSPSYLPSQQKNKSITNQRSLWPWIQNKKYVTAIEHIANTVFKEEQNKWEEYIQFIKRKYSATWLGTRSTEFGKLCNACYKIKLLYLGPSGIRILQITIFIQVYIFYIFTLMVAK